MSDKGKSPEGEPTKSPEGEPSISPPTGKSPPSSNSPPGIDTPADILPASHWRSAPLIEHEDDDDDGHSDYGSDAQSSTASLTESILRYRTLHGRTYHSDIGRAEAWQPNDDTHGEVMDLNHHLNTLILGDRLFLAPIPKDVQNVLDVGTGTGIWAIDFADQYPAARVIGTDVSPMQPSWVPPNVSFEIDDANLSWTFRPDHFDYIHVRGMIGCIADWPQFYKEAFRCTKPGGWLEHHDNSTAYQSDDGSVTEDSPMGQWNKVFWEGGRKFGRTFRIVEDDIQRKYMEEAGFVDIEVREFKCPVGTWPKDKKEKEKGMYVKLILDMDLEGFVLYMWSSVMGWTQEEVQVFVAHLRSQLKDPNVHAWAGHRVVYGRKPL